MRLAIAIAYIFAAFRVAQILYFQSIVPLFSSTVVFGIDTTARWATECRNPA
jgi:hypothetical protein